MSDMGMYYDIDGKPMEMMDWAAAQNPEYKRVAQDTIEKGGRKYWVSTVWMGIDHGFGRAKAPLIFETMVFDAGQMSVGHLGEDLWMDRYATKTEALAGHEEICRRVRNCADPKDWQQEG